MRGPVELALDLVDEVEVQLEEPAHEAGDEQQVLAPVGKVVGRRLGLLEPGEQVGAAAIATALLIRRRRTDEADAVGEVALQAA